MLNVDGPSGDEPEEVLGDDPCMDDPGKDDEQDDTEPLREAGKYRQEYAHMEASLIRLQETWTGWETNITKTLNGYQD